jgi:hypothetical protein
MADRQPLTEKEVQRLARWASHSTLPAWREFDAAASDPPQIVIHRLIEERQAMRSVLETVGDFQLNLRGVLVRMGIASDG